jgi:hypothetical protein
MKLKIMKDYEIFDDLVLYDSLSLLDDIFVPIIEICGLVLVTIISFNLKK